VPIDLHFLTDSALDDARLADYRDLQDRRLAESSGRFVAESELVVRKLGLADGEPDLEEWRSLVERIDACREPVTIALTRGADSLFRGRRRKQENKT